MKYIIFKTINLKSKIDNKNRIYVGIHKSMLNIFDGYLGDSVWIAQASTFMYPKTPFLYAVKKYGTKSFRRETLYEFDSLEEAIKKYKEVVTNDFIKLDYTYNAVECNDIVPIYLFNLNGELVKKWNTIKEASEFYGYPSYRFGKYLFLNSYWSLDNSINLNEYSTCKVVYLFTRKGKMYRQFNNYKECMDYLNCSYNDIVNAIKYLHIINNWYISNKLTDEFKPKPRRVYKESMFYIYDATSKFLGLYKGKEVMKVIDLHSWKKIANSINNWYKGFYISLNPIDKVPYKEVTTSVDIYDKYGNYIESSTILAAKVKYNIPSAKVKDIQQGNKFYNDYIFKYNNK